MADFVLAVCGFWAIGFGLMFGLSNNGLFGTSEFFMGVWDDPWMVAFFVFQAVFCGTAATIDSGAIAERTKFVTYLFSSFIVSSMIYPIFGHWCWGSLLNGETQDWLEARGFVDFAGSTVVHSVGGWVALVAAIVIGSRLGKYGKARKIHPHNLVLAYLGTFILFFGWFGFNCGSTLEAGTDIAPIAGNTIIAAAFGGFAATALSWMLSADKRPEAEMIANGVLGGLWVSPPVVPRSSPLVRPPLVSCQDWACTSACSSLSEYSKWTTLSVLSLCMASVVRSGRFSRVCL